MTKTNKVTISFLKGYFCIAHPPSLIRVFAVRLMGSFLHADSEDSDKTGGCPG